MSRLYPLSLLRILKGAYFGASRFRFCLTLHIILAAVLLTSCGQNNADVSGKKTAAAGTLLIDPLFKMNDTGITYGGDYPLGVNDTCEGKIAADHDWAKKDSFSRLHFFGQDCEMGRDIRFPEDDDGHRGFVYQKLSKQGEVLAADAPEWSCVYDAVAGLMWESKDRGNEVKGDGGLHDADDVYTWYSNDWSFNGGSVGDWGRYNELCSGYVNGDAAGYCNSESFVNRVNKTNLCGHTDWRLPTLAELSSLVNFAATEPSIDTKYFPHTQNAPYWSTSLIASSNRQARYVNFRFGQISWSNREEPHRLRLVRRVRCEGEPGSSVCF